VVSNKVGLVMLCKKELKRIQKKTTHYENIKTLTELRKAEAFAPKTKSYLSVLVPFIQMAHQLDYVTRAD
jgi:hypothetical protein